MITIPLFSKRDMAFFEKAKLLLLYSQEPPLRFNMKITHSSDDNRPNNGRRIQRIPIPTKPRENILKMSNRNVMTTPIITTTNTVINFGFHNAIEKTPSSHFSPLTDITNTATESY